MLDGKGEITFNLQLLTDQGIVICPAFHREQQVFTSSALLAVIRPAPASTAPPEEADLPALPAKADVETTYSPTLLPPPPSLRSDDGNSVAPSPASSTAPLDELTVSFAKGAFSLVDTVAATVAQTSAAPNSSPAATQSTTATATAALKRLALTSWRSSTATAAAPITDSDNAAFPPVSALPPTAHTDENPGNSGVLDDEEDAVTGLHGSATTQPTHANQSATQSAGSEPTSTTFSTAAPLATAMASLDLGAAPLAADNNLPAPVTSISSPAILNPTLAASTAASSTSFSPFSLPAALFSSVSSWLFPPAQPAQLPDIIESPITTPPPPTPPPPPPPPPPYASTLRRVVIIGVHGWSLFGGMLGDKPLLVSSRFCYYIQHALLRYMRTATVGASGGSELVPLHITCIPLHGHGRVEERVSMYVESQLPQYADELRQADHIIIACHSQGCMVTSSLLALLLLTPNPAFALPSPPHISILMLAGLHHGPFPDLPTDMYPPTKELLSYSHFHTTHSQLHIERMHRLLAAGVRVMLVGSVHDAVVPLYSSLGQLLGRSPNLVRAMYVDYQHYQPDFLYSLLSLTLYLANRPPATASAAAGWAAGGSDVLVHLAGFLRGSLLEKAGGAHSAMHRLVDVYGLAVEWAMGGAGEVATPAGAAGGSGGSGGSVVGYSGVMWSVYLTDGFTTSKLNRHLLVWSVRGMLMELEGRRGEKGLDVDEELQRLNELFAEWSPKTKNLRAMRETLAVVFGDGSRSTNIQSNL